MDNDYKNYLASITKLAKTIVIKSSDTATLINNALIAVYGDSYVNQYDPSSWKYYLNICGQYHKSDTSMKVVSWDTAEEIEFNTANLVTHTATKAAYSYGTNFYNELVSLYPDQEMLILGILYPADLATAVSAQDGTILAYPPNLIEDYEINFIPQLQSWIYGYLLRWRNVQYAIGDDLYTATNLGVMYLFLIPAILVIRKRACKTNEAHSYHVKQYLLSSGISADNYQYLNREQQLFLYRNINYIRRHAGEKETFDTLVEKLMTIRNIPLSSYVMKHDSSKQLTDLTPKVKFAFKPLNDVYKIGTEYRSLSTLLQKESGLSIENNDYINDQSTAIEDTLKYSLSDTVETKVLETSIVDYEEGGQYSLETIMLNYWVYLSTRGLMKSYVRIADVKTESSSLHSAKDAFVIAIYALAKTLGITMKYVPDFPAIKVERIPVPTVDELSNMTDKSLVSNDIINEILSLETPIEPITSLTEFQTLCTKIRSSMIDLRNYSAFYEDPYRRGLVQNLVSMLYCDYVCKLNPTPITYSDWFSNRFLDYSQYSTSNFTSLYNAILTTVTGIESGGNNTVARMHAAMINLFTQLSSYSIQFIKQATNIEYIDLGVPQVRVAYSQAVASDETEFDAACVDVLEAYGKSKDSAELDLLPIDSLYSFTSKAKANILMDPAPVMIGNESTKLVIHLDMAMTGTYFSSNEAFNE